MSNNNFLDNLISTKTALKLKNQGTQVPTGNWRQIDLRGNGLLIKHCNSDLEAHLARFMRQALENNQCYNTDDNGQPVSYPGLYIRYYKHYIDLRLDVGTASYGNKVGELMQSIAESSEFHLPLIGQFTDPDGGTCYRFDFRQVQPTVMTVEQITRVPYNMLSLGDLAVDLSHCEPILLSGVSGTGKTATLELLIAEIVPKLDSNRSNPMLYVADPKFSDLKSYVDLIAPKNARQVAQTPAEIAAMLEQAVNSMNKRYRAMQALPSSIGKTALDLGFAPQFVIIDEYSSLLASLGSSKEDKAIKAKIESAMTQLTQKARQASILVIISLQRASVDSGLTSNIRANCDLKILLGNSDNTTISMLFGSQADTNLPQGNQVGGGYYLRSNMPMPEQFFVPDFDLEKVIKAYQPTPRQHIMAAGRLIDQLLEKQAFDPQKLRQIKNELTRLTHSINDKSVLSAISAGLVAANQALAQGNYDENIMLEIQYNVDRAGDRIIYTM